jgi:hypothetical protein
MANVDRPNGFRPIKTLSGAPWTGLIRTAGVADGADIFIGDPVNLETGLCAPVATNDADIVGVAVGFGKKNAMSQEFNGPYNADNLGKRYYDDSESTHTDWVCYYVPVDDVIFEAQTATALTLVVGGTADISPGTGSTTTGISAGEITTNSSSSQIVKT